MLRSPGELRRKVKTWLLFNKYTNVVMVDPLATFKASRRRTLYGMAINMMADTVHSRRKAIRRSRSSANRLLRTGCSA